MFAEVLISLQVMLFFYRDKCELQVLALKSLYTSQKCLHKSPSPKFNVKLTMLYNTYINMFWL